jgi:hypothetical protein
MDTGSRTPITRTPWFLPGFALALGGAMLAAGWASGRPGMGLSMFAIMAVTALVFLLGGRSETIRGLRGDGRDERFAAIDRDATALSGIAVVTAIITAFIVDVARGGDGQPYSWLGAIGGVAYIVAVVVLRLRR